MEQKTNLFSNASDDTQDGQITLTAEYDRMFITVRVTDTGCPKRSLPYYCSSYKMKTA